MNKLTLAKAPSRSFFSNVWEAPKMLLATSSFLLLVVRPGAAAATSSFLLLVAMPFATNSVLATSWASNGEGFRYYKKLVETSASLLGAKGLTSSNKKLLETVVMKWGAQHVGLFRSLSQINQ